MMFEGKVILAPMVRVGSLPMRLLALQYGADLVWGPETVDKALIGCQRSVNPETGTIDYYKGKFLIFRTHPSEKSRLIFQLGTADPELALQAALLLHQDVAGIDVNCGCPKKFSIQAGMGAALLKEPQKLCSILTRLIQGLPAGFPVTAKIRVFDDMEETLNLVRMIAATGVKALTVHARTQNCRPRNAARWNLFPIIAEAIHPLPLIANGDIMQIDALQRIREVPGVSSYMIARGAQWNPSVFRANGHLPLRQVTTEYLRLALRFRMPFSNAKFTLLQMWIGEMEMGPDPDAKDLLLQLQTAKDYRFICRLFGIDGVTYGGTDDLLAASDSERGRVA